MDEIKAKHQTCLECTFLQVSCYLFSCGLIFGHGSNNCSEIPTNKYFLILDQTDIVFNLESLMVFFKST
ncbi:hypothetical protein glysoja_001754 [Glycine soja]|nr:hypothetical protein glysoja_001754 [Glycine soja]